MQNDHSGGVLTGLIFSTLFLLAIGSLSWAPRVRIVDGMLVSTPIVAAADAANTNAGYALASESSVPVKLAPRRSFAHRSHASIGAGSTPWRRADAFATRKRPRQRT
jgi:hypothetical protein